jgi:hypothetical protein
MAGTFGPSERKLMKTLLSSFGIASALLTTLVSAQAADLSPQEAKKIAVDAYIYGYALMTSENH